MNEGTGKGRGRSMDYGLFPCRRANTLNPAVDNAAHGAGAGGRGKLSVSGSIIAASL